MDNQPILATIDPEYIDRLAERKKEIDAGSGARAGIVAALAIGSVPIALAALSREVYGQSALPAAVQGVLDFALALEIFESEFYQAVLGVGSSAAQNSVFNVVRPKVPAVAVATVQQIIKHEKAHVATLTATGAKNVFGLSATSFDFTGGRTTDNSGPFQKAGSDVAFLLEVAQAAEDTGVRAYKGQAANLMVTPNILEAALRIHSVEARHASRIRRLRRLAAGAPSVVRLSGTIRGNGRAAAGATDAGTTNPGAVLGALDLIYGPGANRSTAPSEDNTTHLGIDVNGLPYAAFGSEAATEAFDEPLDRGDVVKIVQGFFLPTIQ